MTVLPAFMQKQQKEADSLRQQFQDALASEQNPVQTIPATTEPATEALPIPQEPVEPVVLPEESLNPVVETEQIPDVTQSGDEVAADAPVQNWKHKYDVVNGKYKAEGKRNQEALVAKDATVAALTSQVSVLQQSHNALQAAFDILQGQKAGVANAPQQIAPEIEDDDDNNPFAQDPDFQKAVSKTLKASARQTEAQIAKLEAALGATMAKSEADKLAEWQIRYVEPFERLVPNHAEITANSYFDAWMRADGGIRADSFNRAKMQYDAGAAAKILQDFETFDNTVLKGKVQEVPAAQNPKSTAAVLSPTSAKGTASIPLAPAKPSFTAQQYQDVMMKVARYGGILPPELKSQHEAMKLARAEDRIT
jgi:hypothetical protein